MKFLDGLSEDIRNNLLEQLKVLWTHTSTALEGNTLSLEDTAFVLREGLTISGRPLKDHRDVEGHARAVDLMFKLIEKDEITVSDLFDLHKLVIDEQILDAYKPVGAWKKENNSTNIVTDGKQTIIEYSNHWEVPELMDRWLDLLNSALSSAEAQDALLNTYAKLHLSFVGIHPFWDGNGRVARLVSNLPCLKKGYPPVVISKEHRHAYIMSIAEYQLAHGVPSAKTELIHEGELFDRFLGFCGQNWKASQALVAEAHALQRKRERRE